MRLSDSAEAKRSGLSCVLDKGIVAEDQIDPLLLGGEGSPVGKLALVGHDAAFEPVMDREDAVVGLHLGKLFHHGFEIWAVTVRRLPRPVRGSAILRIVCRDDAEPICIPSRSRQAGFVASSKLEPMPAKAIGRSALATAK